MAYVYVWLKRSDGRFASTAYRKRYPNKVLRKRAHRMYATRPQKERKHG